VPSLFLRIKSAGSLARARPLLPFTFLAWQRPVLLKLFFPGISFLASVLFVAGGLHLLCLALSPFSIATAVLFGAADTAFLLSVFLFAVPGWDMGLCCVPCLGPLCDLRSNPLSFSRLLSSLVLLSPAIQPHLRCGRAFRLRVTETHPSCLFFVLTSRLNFLSGRFALLRFAYGWCVLTKIIFYLAAISSFFSHTFFF